MLFGIDLLTFVSVVGIFGVTFLIFAESGLLIGFFLPGDSVLFAAGLLINSGVIHFNIVLATLLFFIASTLGNSVCYLFGQKAGPRLFAREDARFFKRKYIERAQAFYDEHGGMSIILARFIPVVRTFAPIVAGAGEMPYRRSLAYNVIGGLIWTAGMTLVGFYLGKWFEMIGIEPDTIILPLVAVVIIISALPPALHILLNKKRRNAFVSGFKREFRAIFRKK